MRGAYREGRASGFTLVELLLAIGLLSILVIALVRLLDTSLTIWDRTEVGRELYEVGNATLDLLAEDLLALEGGRQGDLVGAWVRHDTDADGIAGLPWPRLIFVRQVTASDLRRAEVGQDPRLLGLVEVCWTLLPARDADADGRAAGVLWRGQRSLREPDTLSFLDERFFDAAGRTPPGSLNEVVGGVLWFSVAFATPTSVLHDGWRIGDDLSDVATSWDAWSRGRPDLDVGALNEPGAGTPEAKERLVLPRRVRVELELERPVERRRRTRLSAGLDPAADSISVQDAHKLPEVGGLILVGEEWMRVLSKSGDRVAVQRGLRGTRPTTHERGALVHHGWRVVREIPVGLAREEWGG